jgi:ferric-dicitrate binding protein FerR (iron transport regulator)
MTDEPINLTPELERVRDAVRGLGIVPADTAFRERLKQEFVSGDIVRQQVLELDTRPGFLRRFGRVFLPLAAVAMAVVLILVLLPGPTWQFHGITGQGLVAVNGVEVDATDVETLARLIKPGARITVPEGVALDLIAGDVLLLELGEGAEAIVPQNPGRRAGTVMLSELAIGELRLKTGPGFSGRQFNVRTPEGLIEVTGTIVSVVRMPDLTCVCVFEGTARIGQDPESMDLIPAGQRKVMFLDRRPPMITEIMPEHQHGLEGFLERNLDAFQ